MAVWTELLSGVSMIPVLVIDKADDAVPLAKTLVAAGMPVLEITLRTPEAMEAIRRVAEEVPEAIVGAGTMLEPEQFDALAEAGGRFAVSPGHTGALLEAAIENDMPFLPGVQTLSEMLFLRECGFTMQKFFPAEQSGGAAFLKTVSGVVGDISFCPTGGISPKNAADYLSLPNVACIGGSWMAPRDLIQANDWDEIGKRAKDAVALCCK